MLKESRGGFQWTIGHGTKGTLFLILGENVPFRFVVACYIFSPYIIILFTIYSRNLKYVGLTSGLQGH